MKLDTRYCRGVVVLAVLASALTAVPLARADWREPVGGPSPINADKTRNASSPSLTTVGGTPHVAWVEDTTQPGQGNSSAINVARFTADGKAWERLAPGSPISRVASASSFAPSLADIGGVPWVAWSENAGGDLCPGFFSPDKQVHVARLASLGRRVDRHGRRRSPDHARPRRNGQRSDPRGERRPAIRCILGA